MTALVTFAQDFQDFHLVRGDRFAPFNAKSRDCSRDSVPGEKRLRTRSPTLRGYLSSTVIITQKCTKSNHGPVA